MPQVWVPIEEEQMIEIVFRSRGRKSVSDVVWSALESWLMSTRGDPDIWSDEHAAEVEAEEGGEDFRRVGSPIRGYRWKNVFLPNGTKVKMIYKGEDHFAEIRHEKFVAEGKDSSPSAWANRVAGFTARNAWRDLWVWRPGDSDWHLADQLRHQERQNG